MTDDIVAELDRWGTRVRTAKNANEFVPMGALLQRARDEIVALRGFRAECERQFQAQVAEVGRLLDHVTCPQVRAEALEEAAMVADRWEERPEFDRAAAIAKAIRALKKQ